MLVLFHVWCFLQGEGFTSGATGNAINPARGARSGRPWVGDLHSLRFRSKRVVDVSLFRLLPNPIRVGSNGSELLDGGASERSQHERRPPHRGVFQLVRRQWHLCVHAVEVQCVAGVEGIGALLPAARSVPVSCSYVVLRFHSHGPHPLQGTIISSFL